MNEVKAIVCDIDGVLTNGKLTIDSNGEKLFKQFHTRDVRAIRELIFNGYEVYLVTADEWEGARHFADKVGAMFINLKDKGRVLEAIQKPFIAVGDDAWDIPMLNIAEEKYCPKDAHYSVKKIKDIKIMGTKGGEGCIAELVNYLL